MLRKAFMLVSGNAFGSMLLLVRNLIVARLISPEDYGVAATLAISMSIVEMLSYLGLNEMIVVDKDGDDPAVQSAMQGFQVFRGAMSCLILFLIAQPYADFLGVGDIAWAYQAIAFIPLINGLQHYDIHRLKRHMDFTPSILANAVPALVSVLSLWPLAVIYGDFRIMLVALFVQAATFVVLSHLTAKRGYRLSLDFALIKRAMVFGWPLLLNGVLLFGAFNGERLIVGRELGMAQLAVFSMAFTLTLTPTLVLAGSSQSFFLPQLSAARDRPETFQRLAMVTMESSLVIGIGLVACTSLIGGPLAFLLLGEKYMAMLQILLPMAVLQAVRVAKTGSAVVALAKERSGNAMAANLFRVLSLPLSWYVAISTGEIMAMIWIACGAELLGYLVSVYLAARRTGLTLKPMLRPAVLSVLLCAVALVVGRYYPSAPEVRAHLHWAHLAVVLASIAALFSMSELRRYLVRRILRR